MEQPPLRVLYNDSCPICSREIGHYRRAAVGREIAFDPLDRSADWGIEEDMAARQLHVRRGDEVLEGIEAFRALWAALPGWRWLGRISGPPLIRQGLGLIYDRLLAPALYRAHLRRQRRRG